MLYHYDETGSIYAVTYSATGSGYAKYYLQKNLQGDVVQIVNASNGVVGMYEYDAWGNVIAVVDANGNAITSATNFANINPIRYRTYYYDTETGFYYLNSRYYDPANCRFISMDSRMDLNAGTTNLNLFAYCGNDPVNRADPFGDSFWDVLKEVGEKVAEVGAVVVGIAGVVGIIGFSVAGTIFTGGAAAGVIPVAVALATKCLAITGAVTVAAGTTVVAIGDVGESVVEFSKNSKADPYGRPGQKKQGRENKEKKKSDDKNWRQNSNKRKKPLPKHTPGRDHRHKFTR